MIYAIRNAYFDIKINDLGAELVSVQDKKRKEFIFQPSPLWIGHAKNLFPNIGLQKDDSTQIRGVKYPMLQHGFAKDCIFKASHLEGDSIEFTLESSTFTEKFVPYKFTFTIKFCLDNKTLIQTYKIVNLDCNEMYFGIGCHTGFASDKESYVRFPCDTVTELCRKDMKYMTGETKKRLLYDKCLYVTPENFHDGAHIFKDFSKKEVTLVNPINRSSIDFNFHDFNYMTLWSTPDAQTVLCMMPWCGLPDSDDSDGQFEHKKGNVCLGAKNTFTANQLFTFNNLE